MAAILSMAAHDTNRRKLGDAGVCAALVGGLNAQVRHMHSSLCNPLLSRFRLSGLLYPWFRFPLVVVQSENERAPAPYAKAAAAMRGKLIGGGKRSPGGGKGSPGGGKGKGKGK